MRCSICGGYDHEATTVGCPRHMASSFDHTRTYAPIGYIAGRLAALREVREMVKCKAEYFHKGFMKAQFPDEREFWKHNQSCLIDLGDDIEAMIEREEKR